MLPRIHAMRAYVIHAYNNTHTRNRALASQRSVREKEFFLNISPRPHKRPFLRRRARYQLRKKNKNKNKNKNFLLCHSRKISSLLHSPSSSPCFRFFPPPQWAPLAQTPLKEPRLWELACSGKRGGLRCVYASFLAHPLFRDWPPARGRYLSLSLEFAIPSHVARFAL